MSDEFCKVFNAMLHLRGLENQKVRTLFSFLKTQFSKNMTDITADRIIFVLSPLKKKILYLGDVKSFGFYVHLYYKNHYEQ